MKPDEQSVKELMEQIDEIAKKILHERGLLGGDYKFSTAELLQIMRYVGIACFQHGGDFIAAQVQSKLLLNSITQGTKQ